MDLRVRALESILSDKGYIDPAALEFWVQCEDGVRPEVSNVQVGVGVTFQSLTANGALTYSTTLLGYPMKARGFFHFVKDTVTGFWHAGRSS